MGPREGTVIKLIENKKPIIFYDHGFIKIYNLYYEFNLYFTV